MDAEVRTSQLTVPMHCQHCSQRITDRVGALDGVRRVNADHQADIVTIEHTDDVFEGQIRAKLHEMGFDVEEGRDEQRRAGHHNRQP